MLYTRKVTLWMRGLMRVSRMMDILRHYWHGDSLGVRNKLMSFFMIVNRISIDGQIQSPWLNENHKTSHASSI